jgi:hypothetical protein
MTAVLDFLTRIGWWATGIGLLSLVLWLPLAFVPKARSISGHAILYVAGAIGFMIWTASAEAVLSIWGLLAFLFGLFIMGIGVIPMAIVAFALRRDWETLGGFAIWLVAIIVLRMIGLWILTKAPVADAAAGSG